MFGKNKKGRVPSAKKDFTKLKTPHTYAIIFFVVIACWLLTFLIPAGNSVLMRSSTRTPTGETATRTVLMADTFRYSYNLDTDFVADALADISEDQELMEELEVDPDALAALMETDSSHGLRRIWMQSVSATMRCTACTAKIFYDTSERLHKTAGIWGTEDFGGFGFLNYVFEGLVTGDRSGSAVGLCALILVIGGSFGIIMKTEPSTRESMHLSERQKGLERLALPLLFILFSLGGATFGMAEECIPFAMIMVPFVIALG